MDVFKYREADKFSTAVPEQEAFLQTVKAEKFIQVLDEAKTLEGGCFDNKGEYMYFTTTIGHGIFKLNMKTKRFKKIWSDTGIRPAAVKIDNKGVLYACCLSTEAMGGIFTLTTEGKFIEWIVKGFSVDDLSFDENGGIYFTNFIGDRRNPEGGVYYINPERTKVSLWCGGLCQPNGIAFSSDYSVLWVTEFQNQTLHRFDVKENRGAVPYRFMGMSGPDSCEIDADDNLYVALPQQGRVMVFNKFGAPIGQIVMPGREQGCNTFTTHPILDPNSKTCYTVSKDTVGKDGASIFVSSAYACGNKKGYQFKKIKK